MTKFNRFSVQILGTVDATSSEELLTNINNALGSIPKFRIKAVSHDKWTNGFTGEDRFFDEEGKEIMNQPEATVEEVKEPEIEIEEVK